MPIRRLLAALSEHPLRTLANAILVALALSQAAGLWSWPALQRADAATARAGVDACRAACGPGIALKLILETGALG